MYHRPLPSSLGGTSPSSSVVVVVGKKKKNVVVARRRGKALPRRLPSRMFVPSCPSSHSHSSSLARGGGVGGAVASFSSSSTPPPPPPTTREDDDDDDPDDDLNDRRLRELASETAELMTSPRLLLLPREPGSGEEKEEDDDNDYGYDNDDDHRHDNHRHLASARATTTAGHGPSSSASGSSGTIVENNVGFWTKEEHDAFLSGLSTYGKDWEKVAMRVATRTIEQTKRHGREYIRNVERGEHIRTGYWTKEEHDAFVSGLKMYGEDWEMIAIRVATRTIEQTRRHAREYSKKKAVEGGWDRTSSFGGRDRDDVVPTGATTVEKTRRQDTRYYGTKKLSEGWEVSPPPSSALSTTTNIASLINSIRIRTREESGLEPSSDLSSIVERALRRGYAYGYLVGKTEDELRHLLPTSTSMSDDNDDDERRKPLARNGGESVSEGTATAGKTLGNSNNEGDRIICDDREEREEEEEEEQEEEDSSEEDGKDEDGDEGSRLGKGQESGVAEDVSINADSEGKASSVEDESIENYVDDGSDPDVVSQSVDDASSDEQMSGEDNSIDDGSISGRRSDSECNEEEEDQSVEHGTTGVSVNRLFSRRFSGKMFSHAMNRPISMTSAKKATSRFKQWMGRRNIAAPVRPPTAKKRQLSLQQERWQSNFAALKAYKDKYGDTFVPSTYDSLGRFVRNLRADHHAKSHRLTAERSQMLEEINFQWVLPKKVKVTNAHRKRVRNISKAHTAIQLMDEHCGSLQKEISSSRDENLVKHFATQIAQYVNHSEAVKSSSDEVGHVMMSIFRQGLLAGVTEVDLFHAFDRSDQGNEANVTSSSPDSMSHPHLTNNPSQGSNSFNESLSDREAEWTHYCKRIRMGEQANQMEEEVDNEDWNHPMLLSSRLQSKKMFDVWLADRKNMWRQQQKKAPLI